MILNNTLKQLVRDERGATAVEYGLIASLICIASLGAFEAVADENNGVWGKVETEVQEAMNEN